MKRILYCAALSIVLAGSPIRAQEGNLTAVLKTLRSPIVNGYDTTIGGATIQYHSVNPHARNAMIKTGARSRAQLVAKALAEGLALGAGAQRAA